MLDAKKYIRELDLEVCQRTKDHGIFVGWHSLKFFALLLAKRLLFYSAVPFFFGKRLRARGYFVCHLRRVCRTIAVYCSVTIIIICSGLSKGWH